jgi:bacillithiol system protein YtxJ
MITPCLTDDDFHRALADSASRPVLLLKHSTRCPISAGAEIRFRHFADTHPEVECWQVLVIEQRAIADLITVETGVTHQSPQVILFRGGKPVWHTSHHSITETMLETALSSAAEQ